MTRNGKIARLPKEIREELNRRLDDGEEGLKLIEWLNGLPEVQKILASDFEGRPIASCNLTEWKNGGFLDWQARREAREMVDEWQAEDADSAPSAELFTSMLMTHYAVAFRHSNADTAEEPRERLKRLGKSMREMARLHRCEIGREQLALMREKIELQRAKMKNKSAPNSLDAREAERQRHEEKAEMVRQMVRDARAKLEAEKAKSIQQGCVEHEAPSSNEAPKSKFQ